MCRLFLDALWKYRAVEMSMSQFWEITPKAQVTSKFPHLNVRKLQMTTYFVLVNEPPRKIDKNRRENTKNPRKENENRRSWTND